MIESPAKATTRPTLPRLSLRLVGFAVYIGVNVGLLLAWGPTTVATHDPDWALWRAMPRALAEGHIYDTGVGLPYLWSPVLAPLMALVGIVGTLVWSAIHVAALALLRDWRLIVLILLSVGFWTNVAGGNTFTFVLVAAVLALRGSRAWALVYLTLLFLMPRPVQVPLALWLLWVQPTIRLPALGLFVLHAAVVAWTGYGLNWVETMLATSTPDWQVGPSHWLGLWWLLIGVPFGAILLWRGHPGWAGLMVNPYWLPHYLLMPLIELAPPDRQVRDRLRHQRDGGHLVPVGGGQSHEGAASRLP